MQNVKIAEIIEQIVNKRLENFDAIKIFVVIVSIPLKIPISIIIRIYRKYGGCFEGVAIGASSSFCSSTLKIFVSCLGKYKNEIKNNKE